MKNQNEAWSLMFQRAAIKHAESEGDNGNAEISFLEGVKFCEANAAQIPQVKELIEALECDNTSLCDHATEALEKLKALSAEKI